MAKITIYKSMLDVSGGFTKEVNYAFERIRNGNSKVLIEKIRTESDKEKQQALKKQLPVINFQGTFKERNDKGLKEFSGLMPLDFDSFASDTEFVEMRERLMADQYTYSLFTSPRGNGLKCIIKIPLDGAENYKGYFDAIKKYYDNPYFDVSNSNVSRLCFESYDPEIYINDSSLLFTESIEIEYTEIGTERPIFQVTSDNEIIQKLLVWYKKNFGQNKGSRNNNLFKLAAAMNTFGVPQRQALSTLISYEEMDFTKSEIESLCNSAYKNSSQFGTRFFEDTHVKAKIEKQLKTGKSAKAIIKLMPEIDSNKIEQAAEQIRNNADIEDFWYYDERGNVKLFPHKYKFWLQHNNFSKYFPTNSKTYTFIQVSQGIVEETNEKRIKDFVLSILLHRHDIGFQPYDHMANSKKAFTVDFLSMLDSSDIKIREDTNSECYLYYKNCVVRITADTIETIDYLNIDGYVWKNQIIDREYISSDHHDSEFRKFIWLIASAGVDEPKNRERYNTFKSTIGFLMHSFKTSANNKAVILNDSVISENPNGGSGKGIFCAALAHLKKVASIDGKTFDFEKSFPYQTVSTDCQLLVFDDVKRNFDFERLFSLITEGITIEYKGQDAIKLPVQKSPKIIITTNYTVGGVGGSFERRKTELELSSYFNSNRTPLLEFGHLLFDEWDADEWAKFDNYMIQCSQFYLKYGITKSHFSNIETRKYIKNTSHEFYEWTKNKDAFKHNEQLSKKVYFDTFIEEYPDWGAKGYRLTQKRFKMWLESYCKFYGYEYLDGVRSVLNGGTDRYFEVKDMNYDDAPKYVPFDDSLF